MAITYTVTITATRDDEDGGQIPADLAALGIVLGGAVVNANDELAGKGLTFVDIASSVTPAPYHINPGSPA